MKINLDLTVGMLCGWIALCVFALHVISSPKRHNWMTIPEYVRRGFLVAGTMMTWRSVNLMSLADAPYFQIGHVNPEAVMGSISMAYLVTAIAWWVATSLLPNRAWDRLRWAQEDMAKNPDDVPVMVPIKDVPKVSAALSETPIIDVPVLDDGSAPVRRFMAGKRRG